jgi:hypothetical protein
MTELIKQLVEDLRNELKEYGEMLALLQEQQEHLMSRRVDNVLNAIERINGQTLVLKRARGTREETQRSLARVAGHPGCTGILVLAQYLPEDYRPLLQALVSENNQLLSRVQQRGRQNYLMLNRAVELMHRFISSLTPGHNVIAYGGKGEVFANTPSHALYEALG